MADFQKGNADADSKKGEASVKTDFDNSGDDVKSGFDKLHSHVQQYNSDLSKDALATWDDITQKVDTIKSKL